MYFPRDPLLRAGLACQQQQNWDAAADFYHQASQAEPVESRFLLGWLAYRQGQTQEALKRFESVLTTQPDFWPALLMLGNLLMVAGDAETALGHYQRALLLAPDERGIQLSIASAWQALAIPWETRKALVAYLEAFPADANAWQWLAELNSKLNLNFQAAVCLERSLKLRPADLQAWIALNDNWIKMGHQAGVRNYFDQMLQLSPAGQSWFASQSETMQVAIVGMRYLLHYQHLILLYGSPDVTDQQFFDYVDQLNTESLVPVPDKILLPQRPFDIHPLRVGYLSREFGCFSSAAVLWPVISHHGTNVELYAYDDGTSQADPEISACFAHWHDVSELDNPGLAELIRADGIDVLVDMGGVGNVARHALFASRPAPVQVHGLGVCFSSCHPYIEYCFSDARFCPPDIAARYPETVILLSSVFHWRPPEAYALSDPPVFEKGFLTFGSANTLNKLNPRVLSLWARLLLELPTARLFLKTPAFNDACTRDFWYQCFATLGIGAERLHFEGQGDKAHIPDYYPQIDIALDPFPYQGGITSCEALWMGVPIVSLYHPDWRARAGTAPILTTIGCESWVTHTEDAYLRQALSWARDPEFLRAQRYLLRSRLLNSPLCDGAAAAREIEAAFRWMLEQNQAKRHPSKA